MPKDAISECVKAAKILDEIRSKRFLPIPEGWFTVQDYAGKHGCTESTARKDLSILINNNKLQKKEWIVARTNGRSTRVPIYKTT